MHWMQFGFQDAISPVMEELIYFHDYSMTVLVFIMSVVMVMICMVWKTPYTDFNLTESQWLESVWTILPAIILLLIAIPSISLLYWAEEADSSAVTLKVIGNQWFWTYEYPDYWNLFSNISVEFDSYIQAPSIVGEWILDTDNHAPLPFLTPIRMLVSSSDVIHSWTIPSLGIKMDATPGRLNQTTFMGDRPGVVYGQCSEICGANHSFMPIVVEFVSPLNFTEWIMSSRAE